MPVHLFRHHPQIRADYPQLSAVAIQATLHSDAQTDKPALEALIQTARCRLATASEGEFPEIQSWRRVFSSMGFKPTQYRSASEALLRRLRIEGDLPSILPIIDLCNAVSVAYAVPVAVFDLAHIYGDLTVRHAHGTEVFETFGGEIEHPAEGEVVFVDDSNVAHARRWPHKQARTSAARPESTDILIVGEAMHQDGTVTQQALGEELSQLLSTISKTVSEPMLVGPDGFQFRAP